MIIFTNGASSSGKTSLARALQETWASPLLYVSFDTVISQLPNALTGEGAKAPDGFPVALVQTPAGIAPLVEVGPVGRDLISLSAQYIALLTRSGYDVVVDYVLLDEHMYQVFKESLSDADTIFVGVTCDPKVLEQREAFRGDRLVGLAAQQEKTVHFCSAHYDLTLDSSTNSPVELASMIVGYVSDCAITPGLGKSP